MPRKNTVSRLRLASAKTIAPHGHGLTLQPPESRNPPAFHLTAGLRMGSAKDLDTAKADFKAAWEALKAKTSPEELAAAYEDLNIRDDDDDKSPDEK
jgi:hypothetical protein